MHTIEDIFLQARILRPYYALPLSSMIPIERSTVHAVAVDRYWRVYYNPDWLLSLPIDTAAVVIADHELGHLLRNHAARAEAIAADPTIFNAASDAEINDDIPVGVLPGNPVYPSTLHAPDGLTAEEYYDYIPRIHIQSNNPCSGGSGAGNPIPDELPAPGDGAQGIDAATAEAIRGKTAAAIIEHAKREGQGSVSSGMLVWANAHAIRPRAHNWRALFARAIAHSRIAAIGRGREDYSWRHPSRKRHDLILPSTIDTQLRVSILVDTSGSMCDEGNLVLGYVRRLLSDKRYCTTLYAGDTEFYRIKNKRRVQYTGSGGTDLRDGIALASRNADCLVIITDCETYWPDAPTIPTVVVSTSDQRAPDGWHTIGASS